MGMNKRQSIAASLLWAERKDKARRRVVAQIEVPEPDPHPDAQGDFRCAVRFGGFQRRRFVYGVDSVQALMLAVSLMRKRVKELSAEGWLFYLEEKDDCPIDLEMA